MANRLVSKFIVRLRHDGPLASLKAVLIWLMHKKDPLHSRRVALARELSELLTGTVRYGPFKGLKLTRDSWWSGAEQASMLFGLYEKEVLESLTRVPPRYSTFIDCGAADGYYGVGVLVSGRFEKSYCFETSRAGQTVIRKNAERNGVSDRVVIKGTANKEFYKEILSDDLRNCVLLIDIEGGEFDLLDKSTFKIFERSIIFVELHEWLLPDGQERLRLLRESAASTHCISELTTGARDLSRFVELKNLSDTDRWLICSEGRGRLMTWLRFDPLS